MPDRPTYPDTPRVDVVDDLFGHRVADPYRYLEDPADPRTVAWSAAQAELLAQRAAELTTRDHWHTRVQELLGAGGIGAPAWRGQRQFVMRREGDQEHAVLLTIAPDGTESVLVDPAALDPSLLTTLDAWAPAPEGDLLAYQLSESGTEESVLRVMDVATGEVVDGPIDRARYSPVAWLPDGTAYYYVRRLDPALVPEGEEQFHRRVWLHVVGTDPAEDVLVFGDGRRHTEYYGVEVSRDGRWLIISAAEGTAPRNDVWISDIGGDDPGSTIHAPRLTAVQEGVDAQTGLHVGRDGVLYVLTDRDAPRNRLAVTDPYAPGAWTDLVPEDPVAVLDGFAVLDGPGLDRPLLLVSWTRHAVGEVTVHDLRTGERLGTVELPGLGSIGALMERPEGGHEAWFTYTDHTNVGSVHRYDASTGRTTLWTSAPGSVEVPAVRTAQVEYESPDGTTVRMFVLSPRTDRTDTDGAVADRPRPTILYGYGGFGLSMTPAYSATMLAWVEAGGVYAVANIRGGGEEGEQWHRDGMLANKQNSFDDFLAAAGWLVEQGFTTREQLSVNGGSNGGLLVGAALTQRPELFAAVVCSAPLLDMVRYERFGLGATWNVEYGSAADPEALDWLLAYSPYHHVREAVPYPAVLFTVFDSDTRVDPMHARKLAAALQHATSSDRPVLIRAEGDVGHGARSLTRTIDLSADMLAFTARWTGLRPS